MKTEWVLFTAGAMFFAVVGFFYGLVTSWSEAVGVVAIFLTSGLSLLIGAFFFLTSRRIDPRPEDDAFGEISQGAGEQGVFAPYSWWPLPLAFGGAICFLALAVGWWLLFIGIGVGGIALVGWVYEFYRGEHAH